jgi:predicted naringenin-chalcone synthase
MQSNAAVVGIGTAVPEHVVEQLDAAERLAGTLREDPSSAKLVRRAFRQSRVAQRHFSVDDFGPVGSGMLFGAPCPSVGDRMRAFARLASPLAERACRRALDSAGVEARRVTHLVFVSSTGYGAPGTDVDLVRLLGLRPDVERVIVGLVGCYAGFPGLRIARDAVVSRPGAVALLVCLELSSLHFRPDSAKDNLVAHALFADGAAAAVVTQGEDERGILVRLGASRQHVEPDTGEQMTMRIFEDGFRMTLASTVPQLIAAGVRKFVDPLLAATVPHGDPSGIASWCVHPGGRAILDRVCEALALRPESLASSWSVLRDFGNLSSATILFVLEREIGRLPAGSRGIMLGFGPGLTFEGMAFETGGRPWSA